MITLKQIETFLEAQPFAIAGVSRNPRKFGRTVYNELKSKGFNVVPVNPNIDNIDGEKCYKSIEDLNGVGSLIILTPGAETDNLIDKAIKKGIRNIWVQQGCDTLKTYELIKQYPDTNIITGKCIMMFAKPNGVHKFHRSILKFFGRLPK